MASFNAVQAALLLFLALAAPVLAADRLWLKDGRMLEGTLGGDPRLTMTLALPEGEAQVVCAPDLVARIELERTPDEERLLQEGGPSAAWRVWWEKCRSMIDISGSDAGEAGLGLAGALLAEDQPVAAAAIAAQVQAADWSVPRRERAEALILETADPKGKDAAQTEKAARAFLARPPIDPAARVDAWFVLGRIDAARWGALTGAEKTAALNEALDAFLRAPVLLPGDQARAARGLLEAARLASAAGDGPTARRALDDILETFPDPSVLPSARTLRAKLQSQEGAALPLIFPPSGGSPLSFLNPKYSNCLL